MRARSHSETRPLLITALLTAALPAACKQTHTVLESLADGGPNDMGGTDGSGSGGSGGTGSAGAGGSSPPETAVTALSTADDHTCAIAGGRLYCWGANDDG